MWKLYFLILLCYQCIQTVTLVNSTQTCICSTIYPSYAVSATISHSGISGTSTDTRTVSSASSHELASEIASSSLDIIVTTSLLGATISISEINSNSSAALSTAISTSEGDANLSTQVSTSNNMDTSSSVTETQIESSSNGPISSSVLDSSSPQVQVSSSEVDSSSSSLPVSSLESDLDSSTIPSTSEIYTSSSATQMATSEMGPSSSIAQESVSEIDSSYSTIQPSTSEMASSASVAQVSMPGISSSATQVLISEADSSSLSTEASSLASTQISTSEIDASASAALASTSEIDSIHVSASIAGSSSPTTQGSTSVPAMSTNTSSLTEQSASIDRSIISAATSAAVGLSSVTATPMITCVCVNPWMTGAVVKQTSIEPSPASSMIAYSTAIKKPVLNIPSVYFAYYPNLESGSEATVLNVFKYINLNSNQAIAVVDQYISDGMLKYSVDGAWVTLDGLSVSNATVLNGTQKLKFVGNATFTGVIMLKYTVVVASSARFVTNLDGNAHTYYTLYGLMKPEKPSLKLSADSFNKTIQEDSGCSWFTLSEIMDITKPEQTILSTDKIPDLKRNESLANIKSFMDKQKMIKDNYCVRVQVTKIDGTLGIWKYQSVDVKGNKSTFSKEKHLRGAVMKPSSRFCFKPFKDVYGEASALLKVGVQDLIAKKFISQFDLTIRIKISNVNDRPRMMSMTMFAPVDLPYQLGGENLGFTISQLISSKTAQDTDSKELGIAIILGKETQLGKFQYKCSASWDDVNVTNVLPLPDGQSLNTIFLRPNDSLRFEVSGNDTFWRRNRGKDEASIKIVAWDMSNGGGCGLEVLNGTEAKQSNYIGLLRGAADLVQLRKGCDKRAGSIPYIDACNVCMGDNGTCIGCDKRINSGAKFDKCLVCAGGDTNIKPNKDLDCAGTCGKSYNDSCGVCQVRGFTTKKDCNQVCLGTAIKNKCNVCVLGNTNKDINSGKDVCGVCNGDNSTCLDCANVPNGRNRTDLCKKCLRPDDPLFNQGCGTTLGKFKPVVVSFGDVSYDIHIHASTFKNVNSVSCMFNDVLAAKSKMLSDSSPLKVKASTPANLTAGVYTVKCSFTGANGVNATAVGELTVVNSDSITISNISPEISKVGTSATLTITGSGFVNTSELCCFYHNMKQKLTAVFVSSTVVTCALTKRFTTRSMVSNVYLSFVARDKAKLFVQHSLGLDVPSMQSANFSDTLSAVRVLFNAPGNVKKGITCADLFPYNHTAFGSAPICKFRSNFLLIGLIGSPTLGLGTLILNQTMIQARGSKLTIYAGYDEQAVTVMPPFNLKPPEVMIRGAKSVGKCAPIILKAVIPGGAAGGLKYSWSVSLVQGETLDSNQTAKLTALNDTLENKTRPWIKLSLSDSPFNGKRISFTVTVANLLGMKGVASIIVTRVDKARPSLRLSTRRKIKMQASQVLEIQAFAKISACVEQGMSPKIYYQWQLTPDVTIKNLMKRTLFIPGATLKGGKTYQVSLEVGMQENRNTKVTEEIVITTMSSKVVASIDGVQTVSSQGVLVLSAKNSYDPDGNLDNKNVSYIWLVLNNDKSAVILPPNKRLLLPETEKISLNVSSNLKAGEIYIFQLTYRVGKRTASTQQRVRVVDGSPPSVVINAIPEIMNPSSRIEVTAMITDTAGGTYTWISENVIEDGYGMIELSKENVLTKVEGTFRKGVSKVTLKFEKDVLDGGTSYQFNITATNSRSTSASAIVKFKTNSVPTKGLMDVSPTTGVAMSTKFTVSPTEGWSDADGDTLYFKYMYTIGDGAPQVLGEEEGVSHYLPAGSVTVIVRCSDSNGAYSEAKKVIVVTAPNLNSINIDAFTNKLATLSDEQNLPELVAMSTALIDTFVSAGAVEFSDAQEVFRGAALTEVTGQVDLQTSAAKKERSASLAALTVNGKNLSPAMKYKVIDLLNAILGIQANNRRSRRSLSSPSVDAKSPKEVETDLKSYSNIISPTIYDTNSMSNKMSMLTALDKLTASMCKGIAVGQDAGVAQNPLVYLQTINKDFSDVDTTRIKLGCSSCYMTYPDYVLLGSVIKNSKKCGANGDTECPSACISSWQMKYDLLSSSANSSMKSYVIAIKLWNSDTQAQLDLAGITLGMVVDIVGTNTNKNKSYVCNMWDASAKAWATTGVKTVKASEVEVDNSTIDVISCSVTKLGYLALFEGPDKIEPTASTNVSSNTSVTNNNATTTTTTKASVTTTTTTTLSPENFPRICTFSFDYPKDDCLDKLNASRVSFTNDIKGQVASAAGVPVGSFNDFNVSCASIVVKTRVVKSGAFTATAIAKKLETAVSNGTMYVMIDNKRVNGNKDSFTVQIDPKYQKPVIKAEDDGLSTGAIVGIVIGVVVALVIIVVIVYFCCIKKNTRKPNTVEPDDNALELKGRSNQAYTGYP